MVVTQHKLLSGHTHHRANHRVPAQRFPAWEQQGTNSTAMPVNQVDTAQQMQFLTAAQGTGADCNGFPNAAIMRR